MKLIDKKGKLFGVINVVDLLAALAVLLVVGGVCWKLFAPKVSEVVAPQVTMTTTLRVRGASVAMVAQLEKSSPVGKKLVSGNDYVADTEVMSMAVEPYVIQVETADGRIVSAADPEKQDIVLVVTSKVSKDTPVPKIANQEVRCGRTFTFKTNDFETYANIEAVDFSE